MTTRPEVRRPTRVEPLWRDALGSRLRRIRQRRRLTLVETATRAGISAQYLSEIERGRKDPSSEMISAIVGALQVDLAVVLDLTARDVRARIDLVAGHPGVVPSHPLRPVGQHSPTVMIGGTALNIPVGRAA